MSERKKFVEKRIGGDFEAMGKQFGLNPLIARIMRNRGVSTEEEARKYLYGNRDDLYSPYRMKNAEAAAELLLGEIQRGAHIRVIGDYDIDGVMSSYILTKGLKEAGARVSVQIPHRISDGYGLNANLIEEAKRDGVDCILTCDNGISAIDEIALAKSYGMTVVVTDHHRVTSGLPAADVIVNPHQEGDSYPCPEICGATVAWKVLCILYEKAGLPQEKAYDYIEAVGFATVGDIMPMQDENRILVKEALRSIRHTKNLGMRALIDQCGLKDREIKSYHFGFVLGPCINATGRLDTAQRALSLFLTEDPKEALALASELVTLNEERKEMTKEGVEQAIALYEEGDYDKDPVIVLFLPQVHESIAGIIAGRVREAYYKPTFILTKGEDCIKGSARSIEEYSLAEEMTRCRELFLKFGGHPKAAGLSLAEENVETFRRTINELCPITVEEEVEKISIDARFPVDAVTMELVEQLEVIAPLGNENESVLLGDQKLSVAHYQVRGKAQNVLSLSLVTERGNKVDGIYFGDIPAFLDFIKSHDTFSIVYSPKISDFGGAHLEFEVKYYL